MSGFPFAVAVEKTSEHKTGGDGFDSPASNTVLGGVGATSVIWTPEVGRERGTYEVYSRFVCVRVCTVCPLSID